MPCSLKEVIVDEEVNAAAFPVWFTQRVMEYQREYDALANEYDRVNSRIQAMEDRNRDKEKCRRKLEIFLGLLEKVEVCKAFMPYTFATLVEKVVVERDGRLDFFFRNGMIVEYLLKS